MWVDLLRRYLLNPEQGWPNENNRQAVKLQRRLDSIDSDRERTVDRIVSLAERRMENRPKAILLPNAGSSGSHWLAGMLGGLAGIIDCGEVYLPPLLFEDLSKFDENRKSTLIDGIHLAHSRDLRSVGAASLLINSAHTWRIADALEPRAMIILLVRDPVEILLSRTFRKPDYREAVAPNATDSEYLDQNISFVKRFYMQASHRHHDCLVHYEEVRADTIGVLGRVCASLGLYVRHSELFRIAASSGVDEPGGNKFVGPQVEPPHELTVRARDALRGIRSEWGYCASEGTR